MQDNNINTNLPEILTRREAALYLRMSERGLRRYLEQGIFKEIRVGRKRLLRRSSLDRTLENLEISEVA